MNRKVIIELIFFFVAVECLNACDGNILSDMPEEFFELDKNSKEFQDNNVVVAYYSVPSDNYKVKIGYSMSGLIVGFDAYYKRWDGIKKSYEDNYSNIKFTEFGVGAKDNGFAYFNFPKQGVYRVILYVNKGNCPECLNSAFAGCENLICMDFSCFCPGVKTTALYKTFQSCKFLEKVTFGKNFKSFTIGNCNDCFAYCHKLKEVDVENLDVSNVEDFKEFFWLCKDLRYLNLSGWNTEKAVTMEKMFLGCESLISLDLSGFDFRKVKNLNSFCKDCKSLKYFYLPSQLDFSALELPVTSPFVGCGKLYSLPSEKNFSDAGTLKKIFLENALKQPARVCCCS